MPSEGYDTTSNESKIDPGEDDGFLTECIQSDEIVDKLWRIYWESDFFSDEESADPDDP